MKPFLFTLCLLLAGYCSFSQQIPADRRKSTTQPPLRGEKDLRPKQFAARSSWKPISDLSAPLNRLQQLSPGDSLTLGVITSNNTLKVPISAKLVKRRTINKFVTSYYFTVQYPAGSWLYLTQKKTPGGVQYSGSVMNKKYSDGLVLKKENGRYYFEPIEQTSIVTD